MKIFSRSSKPHFRKHDACQLPSAAFFGKDFRHFPTRVYHARLCTSRRATLSTSSRMDRPTLLSAGSIFGTASSELSGFYLMPWWFVDGGMFREGGFAFRCLLEM